MALFQYFNFIIFAANAILEVKFHVALWDNLIWGHMKFDPYFVIFKNCFSDVSFTKCIKESDFGFELFKTMMNQSELTKFNPRLENVKFNSSFFNFHTYAKFQK